MRAPRLRSVLVLVLGSFLAGCVDPYGQPNYTGSGALIGGGSGAVLGAALDHHNPGAGALIGGAAGLLTGSLIGHGMDEDARRRYYYPPAPVYIPPPPAPAYVPPPPAPTPPPSISDIKSMARSGVSEDVILAQITRTHGVYSLDANAIIDLKKAGVSDAVVHLMMMSGSDTVVQQAPPLLPTETIVASPGPDYYWCRGEWSWSGSAWIWIPGRWVAPPHRGAIWVETYWVHGPNGWYRVPGHWR